MELNIKSSIQVGKVPRFHALPEVLWLQDEGRILVVNQHSQEAHWLDGQAALVWSWLNSGVSFSACVKLLSALNQEQSSRARNAISSYLTAWQESSLVHLETEP